MQLNESQLKLVAQFEAWEKASGTEDKPTSSASGEDSAQLKRELGPVLNELRVIAEKQDDKQVRDQTQKTINNINKIN